jgi:membrane protease YdiL (CAAX protease family)
VLVAVAGGVVILATIGFSRATGRIAEVVPLPAGSVTLIAAVLLTCWAPSRFGWRWGDSGRRWREIALAVAGVVAVVGAYRLGGGDTPYQPSAAELIVVPLGEEALFRGFVLTVLVVLFRRWLPSHRAVRWAIIVGALSFGAGHLGNLGYVPTGFVLVQAAVAAAFGVLAGWLRIRTDSLVGPVLAHAAMNLVAVW